MLVKPIELTRIWFISPNGVLHVGAHKGEEKVLYDQAGWGPIIWIEAQPNLAADLEERFSLSGDQIICATVWNKNGIKLKLNISSNSGSSSLLEFGSHLISYPEITYTNSIEVETSRLDAILSEKNFPDFMNLDIQGVELQALESLGELIIKLNYVYVEINTKEVYKGCTKLSELDNFMYKQGFKRMITRRYIRHGWGEALYIRKKYNRWRISTIFSQLKNASDFYSHQIRNAIKHILKGIFSG